jgi:hypothetical protein
MPLLRRTLLLAPAALAACAEDEPLRTFAPLRYDFLTPLRLNVATVDFAPAPPPGPLDAISPIPAAEALRQMAQDRLSAGGSSGSALVTAEEARLTRAGNTLNGTMALRVDVMAADGTKAGFAEARVSRSRTGLGRDLRGPLYDITKQMLDDMNVELEYQLRLSLRDYMQTAAPAPASAPVEKQDLPPPTPAI